MSTWIRSRDTSGTTLLFRDTDAGRYSIVYRASNPSGEKWVGVLDNKDLSPPVHGANVAVARRLVDERIRATQAIRAIGAKVTRRVTTRQTHRVELDQDMLRSLLDSAGVRVPIRGAKFFVAVPGGADWSNTDLDIDSENPVVIEWEETTEGTS